MMTRLEEKLNLLTARRRFFLSPPKSEKGPEPTNEELSAITAALDEAEDALTRLIASADRTHEYLTDSRREVRSATEILRWSNQFSAEREANGR